MTMKVAIFTGTISLQRENTDVRKLYILERLKHLQEFKVQLEIITPQANKCNLPSFENGVYNTYKFINRKHLKLISTIIYPISKILKLNCELIHCYTYHAAILAWFINNFRKQKYLIIFEPMGLAYEESKLDRKSSFKVKVMRPFIKYTEKITFKKSDAVAVYTHILKKYVSQKFDIDTKKVYVIPHGINLNTPTIDKAKKSFILDKLNLPKKNKIVMYGGSLSELHGTPYLMEAIKYVNKKKQNVSFLILGRGVLENTLDNYIKKNKITNVYLLGFVPLEDMEIYLSLADILLIPHAKCMQTDLDQPTKLFEYVASGKPIVSFNLKAIAEVVGNNAILVEPDNPKALADGILKLIDDEKLCRELGEKGQTISKEYSWEISAKKQFELYKELYGN